MWDIETFLSSPVRQFSLPLRMTPAIQGYCPSLALVLADASGCGSLFLSPIPVPSRASSTAAARSFGLDLRTEWTRHRMVDEDETGTYLSVLYFRVLPEISRQGYGTQAR